MADDTLSRVDFQSRIVKTNMDGQERHALACMLRDRPGTPRAALVRHVLLAGMEALGWDEERQIKEYAAYRLQCLHNGERNPFESE